MGVLFLFFVRLYVSEWRDVWWEMAPLVYGRDFMGFSFGGFMGIVLDAAGGF